MNDREVVERGFRAGINEDPAVIDAYAALDRLAAEHAEITALLADARGMVEMELGSGDPFVVKIDAALARIQGEAPPDDRAEQIADMERTGWPEVPRIQGESP